MENSVWIFIAFHPENNPYEKIGSCKRKLADRIKQEIEKPGWNT